MVMLLPIIFHGQTSVRAQIDADRQYLDYKDEKTLEKSRGFIRQDSTFYIGYMYRGAFNYTRANDELGFRQDIADLEKAMQLIEKDYDKQIRTRSSDIFTYMRVSTYQNDYCNIIYWLETSYQYVGNPQKAFETVMRLRERNLQMEQGIESCNTLAWIYHRNRMYSSNNFPFLKNSVRENDSMAYAYLDSALLKIRNDAEVNIGLFDASYLNRQYLYTYHYKAILFDYNLEIDSAQLYYDELIRTGYYSSNNYAEFKLAMGDFQQSEQYFIEAEQRDGTREKQTREYFYMRGTLAEYRAHPEEADSLLRKVLDDQGSTPGYGWHSIGLARALHYEGLTSESQDRVTKANNFDELHIATTWGQEQYDLAVATLNYTNRLQFENEYFFENDENWFWLNPVNWYKYFSYSFQVNNSKLILASMVAENPEREKVIYTLFSSENLVNFDEVWNMIDGFGNEYFIGIYKKLLENDKRPKLKKYFRYFLGKLYLAEGKESEAKKYFEAVLNDPEMNDDYQKLLFARACEGMAITCSSTSDKNYWTYKMYEAYPQLVPTTNLKMRFRMEGDVSGTGRGGWLLAAWIVGILGLLISFVLYQLKKSGKISVRIVIVFLPVVGFGIMSLMFSIAGVNSGKGNSRQQIIDGLKNCNIEFTTDRDAPVVEFFSSETKDATEIEYSVYLSNGSAAFTQGILRVPMDQTADGGKLLAYRLFGIHKTKIGYEPDPVVIKKDDKKKKK